MWQFKKKIKYQHFIEWKREIKQFNVQKGTINYTSKDGITESITVFGEIRQNFFPGYDLLDKEDLDKIQFDEPYIKSVEVIARDHIFNSTHKREYNGACGGYTYYPQEKTSFIINDDLVYHNQILLKTELVDIQDHFVDFEEIVGFEVIKKEICGY